MYKLFIMTKMRWMLTLLAGQRNNKMWTINFLAVDWLCSFWDKQYVIREHSDG